MQDLPVVPGLLFVSFYVFLKLFRGVVVVVSLCGINTTTTTTTTTIITTTITTLTRTTEHTIR
jgi:hypothetical protein